MLTREISSPQIFLEGYVSNLPYILHKVNKDIAN